MDREQELVKLVNVLRRTARTAVQAEWRGGQDDAAPYCVSQYNRVLARFAELDPGVAPLFEPLAEDSSLTVVAIACRQLAAYYEDEVGATSGWGRVYGAAFDPESFKEFWRKSASEIEDLGEYIRESVETWARHRPHKSKGQSQAQEDGDDTAE